ncbi:MAG: TolC family protein [Candidatus Gastranaerophilales bacterium]
MIFINTSSVLAVEEVLSEQDDNILSMEECFELALKNSPTIKNYKLEYGISKDDVSFSRSAFFPTLSVGASYSFYDEDSSKINYSSNMYNLEASVSQLLFDFGKTNADIDTQKFYQEVAYYNFDDIVLETIYGVKNHYFGVLAAKANVDVERANVQINERNYQRIKAYYDEGIRSKIDLVNAEVNLSDSKVELVSAIKTYQVAIVELNNSMYLKHRSEYGIVDARDFNISGNLVPINSQISNKRDIAKAPEEVENAFLTANVDKIDIIDDYDFTPFEYNFEEAVSYARENRPDLKAYVAMREALEKALLSVKREYYPELQASAGYGYTEVYSMSSLNAKFNLVSSVNIMAVKSKVKAAEKRVQIAQNDIDKLEQDIYYEIQDLFVNMRQLEKQIPLAGIKVKQTLENFQLADGRYAVGLGDFIELQDAKVQYNNAQQDYVNIVYNYNIARSDIEKSIGLEQEVTLKLED